MVNLTIAIPTYNRPDKCLNLLNDIISNKFIKYFLDSNQLSIIVSDNCSEKSYEQVNVFCNNNNFKYIRQERNLGLVNNFLYCLKNAGTAYVWVIGDDDFISFNVIDEIFNKIKTENPNIILLNHYAVDDKDKILIEDMYCESGLVNENKIIENNGGLMFISANVYNVEFTKQFIKKSPCLAFPLYLSLCCISSQKYSIITKKFIKNVWANTSWKALSKVVIRLQKPFVASKIHTEVKLVCQIQNELYKSLLNRHVISAILKNIRLRYLSGNKQETLSFSEIVELYSIVKNVDKERG